MRSSGRHSNETTKSKERKDGRCWRRGWWGRGQGKKRCAYGRVKKRGRNVEMQTDGVLRSSLVSQLPEESYQEPFSSAGRSPHARSLPTLSTNGYLWMHQSTPLLPGFNAIRIDYIDFARGRNLRSSLQNSWRNASMSHCTWWSFASVNSWTLCPENIDYLALQTYAPSLAIFEMCSLCALRRILNIIYCVASYAFFETIAWKSKSMSYSLCFREPRTTRIISTLMLKKKLSPT